MESLHPVYQPFAYIFDEAGWNPDIKQLSPCKEVLECDRRSVLIIKVAMGLVYPYQRRGPLYVYIRLKVGLSL